MKTLASLPCLLVSALALAQPPAPQAQRAADAPAGLAPSFSLTDERVRETIRARVAQTTSDSIENPEEPSPRGALADRTLKPAWRVDATECDQTPCTDSPARGDGPARKSRSDFIKAVLDTVLGIPDDHRLPEMPPQGLMWRTNKDMLPTYSRPVDDSDCGGAYSTTPAIHCRTAASAAAQPRGK